MKGKPIKLLLFDIDGTLVRLDGAGLKALDKAFYDIFGIKDIAFKVDFFGKTDPCIYEDILRLAGIEEELAEKKYDDIAAAYLKYLRLEIDSFSGNPVIEGVREFLECNGNLSDRILGLLTGNIELGGRIKIERWGLSDYFAFGAFGSDSKKRGELVNIAVGRALKLYNIKSFDKSDIYVIGDTPLDIKCAKDNNVKSVAIATGKYSFNDLARYCPDYCFNKITDWRLN